MDAQNSSRYVDYTHPGTSNGGYRPPSVSSYEYYPPQKPPRREKRSRSRGNSRERSRSRSRSGERYGPAGVYYNPGIEYVNEERAPSDRAESEFTVRNEAVLDPRWEEDRRASRAASEIYEATRFPRARSEISQYSYRSGAPSDIVSVKRKTSRNGKLVLETMTAPHPCCPNTKGVCCLLVLLNLALLLITLGFVIVLQLFDPPFVWFVGLSMLIFGFLVLFGSLIYCVYVCREVERIRPPPGELYWTNQWSKTVNFPEIHYSNTQYKPSDYKGSEFSYKTEPSRTSRTTADTSQRY